MPPSGTPRSWPMKWVILAIFLFVAGYTGVMLLYRKPGKAYRPYQDAADRATVARLLSSGYQRLTLEVERPADPLRIDVLGGAPAARASRAPGGFAGDLDAAMVEKPMLADSYASMRTPASVSQEQACRLLFDASAPDHKRIISSALLFRRGSELSVVPLYEKLESSLQARWKQSTILLTVPPRSLAPGDYRVTLVGSQASLTWQLRVQP